MGIDKRFNGVVAMKNIGKLVSGDFNQVTLDADTIIINDRLSALVFRSSG